VSGNDSKLDSAEKNDSKIDHRNELYSIVHINELAQGDESFIRSILMTFQKNIPIYLKDISEGIIEKDFKRVTSAAHQLKPSIDILEMTSIKDVVRFIEKEALKNDKGLAKLKDSSDILSHYLMSVLTAMHSHFEN
jgi:HPt (histidine-containing phosphotransfer) domain-containing protein